MASLGLPVPHEEQAEAVTSPKWLMKELKPWHKQMCSLLAQGIDRQTIANILDCTPEYVSMLGRQPLIIEYVREMSSFAQVQLEAQFSKAVTAIGETLENGNHKERMQAARLQMEATKRIGSRAEDERKLIDTNARLSKLAERLLSLQDNIRNRPTEATAEVIQNEEDQNGQEAEDGNWSEHAGNQPAQADGNGNAD